VNDFRLAQIHYEMAAEVDPTFANVYFNLALVQSINNELSAPSTPLPGISNWFLRMRRATRRIIAQSETVAGGQKRFPARLVVKEGARNPNYCGSS